MKRRETSSSQLTQGQVPQGRQRRNWQGMIMLFCTVFLGLTLASCGESQTQTQSAAPLRTTAATCDLHHAPL